MRKTKEPKYGIAQSHVSIEHGLRENVKVELPPDEDEPSLLDNLAFAFTVIWAIVMMIDIFFG